MKFEKIDPNSFTDKPFELWQHRWMLLTCGDYNLQKFNTMTVGWGSFGVMWQQPFAQVVVRPTRYTYEFTNEFDSFTLSAFPESYRDALRLLGRKSGRDSDKIQKSGLTPIPSEHIASPAFAEADLIFECSKTYWQDMEPAHFLDEKIETLYPQKDYHRVYYGKIVGIYKQS